MRGSSRPIASAILMRRDATVGSRGGAQSSPLIHVAAGGSLGVSSSSSASVCAPAVGTDKYDCAITTTANEDHVRTRLTVPLTRTATRQAALFYEFIGAMKTD